VIVIFRNIRDYNFWKTPGVVFVDSVYTNLCCDVNSITRDCNNPQRICDSVCDKCSDFTNGYNNPGITPVSSRCRLRTRDRGKRSNAQTVTLTPKQCRAEPLAIEGPSAGGWDGYLRQIGYAIASARSYRVSPAPGWSW
jgi:hypothetical protein